MRITRFRPLATALLPLLIVAVPTHGAGTDGRFTSVPGTATGDGYVSAYRAEPGSPPVTAQYAGTGAVPATATEAPATPAQDASTQPTSTDAPGTEIERSPADTRDYRAVMLDNGLQALVVSDPSTDKAAATLNVNVGSGNDPDERPGLAHFLEHMLFLGTEKYPDAGEYGRFLAEHGGSGNATTSFSNTSYFFDVDAAHLEPALDRFAQFFVSPRLDREYVERERRIVHSEYVSRRRSDWLRGFAAWRQTLHPDHPLSRFLIGNAETLADRPGADVRDDLIRFYDRYYSAHVMKLVVVGREPLDVLERRVRTRFAAVPRRDYKPPRITTPLYPEGLLPARLDIEPVREIRTIALSFALPPLRPHYRVHPLALVSHLLGHEGRGSLLSALKARGWAEGLRAGPGMSHPDFATFRITIQATEAGLAHRDDVIASVFAYLDLIGEQGIDPRYYEELARMARIAFRFQEKTEPRLHAVSLAAALHVYPVHEVLTAPYRFDGFDPELERRFLSALAPDRVLVTVVAKGVSTDAVAPFHDTPYRLEPVPAPTVARWRDPAPDDLLMLPEPNPFVPGDLALIDVQADVQAAGVRTAGVRTTGAQAVDVPDTGTRSSGAHTAGAQAIDAQTAAAPAAATAQAAGTRATVVETASTRATAVETASTRATAVETASTRATAVETASTRATAVETAGARPVRIVRRPGFDLWHHADTEFGQPRMNFYFAVRSPIANDSPRHAVLSSLLARMTNDALNEFAYPAALAGQTYSLYRHRRGISVRLSGWSDKQALLLARIVSTLRAPPLPAPRFEGEKTEYARQLRNTDEGRPFRRAMSDVRRLLLDPDWSDEARLEALATVELEDLREYAARFFERGEIVALAHGNVTAEDAKALGAVLERELSGSMRAARVGRGRVVRLDPGAHHARWLASGHEDHALAVYRQGRGRGFPEQATMALLAQATENRFFHELRTEREIGYIVFVTSMPVLEVPGLALVVQSPSSPPETLYQHVESFLGRSGTALREMPPAVFERHRAAVERALLEAETRLDERTARYWNAIDRESYEFDRRERLLEAVRAVTRNDLADAWRDLVAAPETARGMAVAVSSREPPATGRMFRSAELVADPEALKRRRHYFEEL